LQSATETEISRWGERKTCSCFILSLGGKPGKVVAALQNIAKDKRKIIARWRWRLSEIEVAEEEGLY